MENTLFVQALWRMAKTDLEASKLLYAHKLFCNASFFLQQSIEKANKALSISYGLVTALEARRTSHDHPELFKISAKNKSAQLQELKEKNIDLTALVAAFDKHSNIVDVQAVLESVKNLKQDLSVVDVFTISESELLEIIEYLQESLVATVSFKDVNHEALKSIIQNTFIESLKEHNPAMTVEQIEAQLANPDVIKSMINAMTESQEASETFWQAYQPLQVLGMLVHNLVKCRYPESAGDFDPLLILTEDHPIIKYQGVLHSIVEECFHRLDSDKAIVQIGKFLPPLPKN